MGGGGGGGDVPHLLQVTLLDGDASKVKRKTRAASIRGKASPLAIRKGKSMKIVK